MSIDFGALLYDPVYAVLGVAATLTIGTDDFAVTVKPQLDGIAVAMSHVDIETIQPGAFIRRSELDANGITPAALDGGMIAFDNKTWKIEAHRPKPSGNGEADGEEMLTLSEIAGSE